MTSRTEKNLNAVLCIFPQLEESKQKPRDQIIDYLNKQTEPKRAIDISKDLMINPNTARRLISELKTFLDQPGKQTKLISELDTSGKTIVYPGCYVQAYVLKPGAYARYKQTS